MTIEYQNIHGNRTYKSSLFCMAFENEQDLLDLYNAKTIQTTRMHHS